MYAHLEVFKESFCQDPFEELNSHLQSLEEAISLASSANKNTDEKEQRAGMSLT